MWIKSKGEELLPFVHVITEKSQAACALISLFPWFQIYTGSRALVLLYLERTLQCRCWHFVLWPYTKPKSLAVVLCLWDNTSLWNCCGNEKSVGNWRIFFSFKLTTKKSLFDFWNKWNKHSENTYVLFLLTPLSLINTAIHHNSVKLLFLTYSHS